MALKYYIGLVLHTILLNYKLRNENADFSKKATN